MTHGAARKAARRPAASRGGAVALLGGGAVVAGLLFRAGGGPEREARPGHAVAQPGTGFPDPPADARPLPDVFSLRDGAEAPWGWVVLDRRGHRLHGLDGEGRLLWSAGGEGEGPGELARPAAVAVSGDTVLVIDDAGSALDRFGRDGRFLDRRLLPPPTCLGGTVGALSGWRGSPVVLRTCIEPATTAVEARAEILTASGAWHPVARIHVRTLRGGSENLLATGAMAVVGDSVFLGSTGAGCLRSFPLEGGGAEGGGSSTRCLPPRDPVPVPEEIARGLRRLARGPGGSLLQLRLPEHLPSWDRVFSRGSDVVFRAVVPGDGRELVTVEPSGAASTLPVPATQWTFPGRTRVLVGWITLDDVRVRVFPVETGATEPQRP